MQSLTITNFENFSLGGVNSLTIKIKKIKIIWASPLKLKFANNFIIYQKRPFRGLFGPRRLHSELWTGELNWVQFVPSHETIAEIL